MSKPLSVAIRETTDSIITTIGNSGLPIDVIVYIVQDVLNACKSEAEASYKADIAKMAESEDTENGTE